MASECFNHWATWAGHIFVVLDDKRVLPKSRLALILWILAPMDYLKAGLSARIRLSFSCAATFFFMLESFNILSPFD